MIWKDQDQARMKDEVKDEHQARKGCREARALGKDEGKVRHLAKKDEEKDQDRLGKDEGKD